jgi:O-antigen/teichoic acid export membrane protein
MNLVSNVKARIERYRRNVLFNRLFTVLSIDILVKVSGIVLLPVYLRLMTQEEYGLYGYLLSIIMTFSIVLNFGLYIPLTKFYHDFNSEKEKGKLLFTIGLSLCCLLTIILLPSYLFKFDHVIIKILFKNTIDYSKYRIPVLIAVIATVFNFMLSNFLFASEKIKQIKKYNLWRIFTINIFTITALYFFRDIDSVQVRLESTYLIEFILICFFSSSYVKEIRPVFSRNLIPASLKLAFPIMLSAIFGIIINFSDKFFLEKYGSFTDFSYYYLAIACASVIPMIFTSFQNAWLPLFLKEKDLKTNIIKTNKFMLRLVFVFLGLSVCIMIFMKIIIITGIIQPKYEKTLYILPIILISQTIAALIPLYSNYVIYFEKTHIASLTGFILCIISLGLSLLLIPRYNVYGAATVSLISNIIYLGLYYFIIRVYTKKHLLNKQPAIK